MRGWNGKMLNHYKIKTAKNIVQKLQRNSNNTTRNIHGRNHKQTAYILPAIKSSFIECRVDFFMKRTVNSFHKFLEIGTPYAVFEIPWHKQHASLLIVFCVVFFRLFFFLRYFMLKAIRWYYVFEHFWNIFQVISFVGIMRWWTNKNCIFNEHKADIYALWLLWSKQPPMLLLDDGIALAYICIYALGHWQHMCTCSNVKE